MLLSEGEVVDRAVNFLFLVFITSSCSCFLDSFFWLVGIGVCRDCSIRQERRGEWWVDAGEVSNSGSILYSQSGSNDFVCRLGS